MEKFLSIKQLSEYLGIQVATLYGWVHTREIPYYKIGRLVKFKTSEVEAWLEERRVQITEV